MPPKAAFMALSYDLFWRETFWPDLPLRQDSATDESRQAPDSRVRLVVEEHGRALGVDCSVIHRPRPDARILRRAACRQRRRPPRTRHRRFTTRRPRRATSDISIAGPSWPRSFALFVLGFVADVDFTFVTQRIPGFLRILLALAPPALVGAHCSASPR